MGIIQNLIYAFVHLMVTALDILSFFFVVRILCQRWNPAWLHYFDSIGKPLVAWFTKNIGNIMGRIGRKPVTEKGLMAIGLLALLLTRLMVVALYNEILCRSG